MAGSDAAPLLSRDAIATQANNPPERVEVPEWGGAVLVRGMGADEKAAWEKSLLVQRRKPGGDTEFVTNQKINIRVSLAIRCVVNEAGEPLFTDADAPMLGTKSAAALERIFTKARQLSRIGMDDVATLEADEDFS